MENPQFSDMAVDKSAKVHARQVKGCKH